MAVAVLAEEVAGRRWGEVVERSESVGLSACALAWERPAGLASGGREGGERGRRERGRRERGGGKKEREEREREEREGEERERQYKWEGWKIA